ncbi:porin family protein [Devosia sp. 1566]|uniref:outer membrane protein n=1 Tax=Devosia sp. 1566 TaxID=2499144 RepID=UPI000FD7A016|nr:porin family protein [Devosia sp. 1566]
MARTGKLIVPVLLTLLGVSAAHAADPILVETSTPAALPLYEEAPFDWSGFYAGIYGGARATGSDTQAVLGIQAGVNLQFDFYLVGAEVSVQGLSGDVGETSYGQILGRAGLIVADDALVYAAGGYGIDLGAPEQGEVLLGGGLEFAVSESVTVEAQYLHGFPIAGEESSDQVTLGARFHF